MADVTRRRGLLAVPGTAEEQSDKWAARHVHDDGTRCNGMVTVSNRIAGSDDVALTRATFGQNGRAVAAHDHSPGRVSFGTRLSG